MSDGPRQVFFGARLFDGLTMRDDCAVVVEGGAVVAVTPTAERPRGGEQIDLAGGVLSPGLVDWQVNGGGGVLFNATPTPEALAAIAAALRRSGVTAILPTVITDSPAVLVAALAAAGEAARATPGVLGVHVEGPFIDPRRKGVHLAEFIRPMRERDCDQLVAAKAGAMVVTLAPSAAAPALIASLAAAGIVVSLGHAEATAEEARAAFAAGARAVTHLFNAMSQLGSRAPGLVGAALADPAIVCGLIADGHHVHPAALRAAINAKGAGGIALISDAMPPAAGGPPVFTLQGRRMRRDGFAPDRRLRHARRRRDHSCSTRVRYVVDALGLPLADALRMATSTPARLLGREGRIGAVAPGARADLIHLDDDLTLRGVWLAGATQAA